MRAFFRDLIEAEKLYFRGWITPWSSPVSVVTDMLINKRRIFFHFILMLTLLVSLSIFSTNGYLAFLEAIQKRWETNPSEIRSGTLILALENTIRIGFSSIIPFLISVYAFFTIANQSSFIKLLSELKITPVQLLEILGNITCKFFFIFVLMILLTKALLYFLLPFTNFYWELINVSNWYILFLSLWIILCAPLVPARIYIDSNAWERLSASIINLIAIYLILYQFQNYFSYFIGIPLFPRPSYQISTYFANLGFTLFVALTISVHSLFLVRIYRKS